MKLILSILIVFLSMPALACDEPISGASYNNLIQVSKNHVMRETYEYIISFPSVVDNRHHIKSNLVHESAGEISIPLKTIADDGKVKGSFTVDRAMTGAISVNVVWEGELPCMIFATTKIEA